VETFTNEVCSIKDFINEINDNALGTVLAITFMNSWVYDSNIRAVKCNASQQDSKY